MRYFIKPILMILNKNNTGPYSDKFNQIHTAVHTLSHILLPGLRLRLSLRRCVATGEARPPWRRGDFYLIASQIRLQLIQSSWLEQELMSAAVASSNPSLLILTCCWDSL